MFAVNILDRLVLFKHSLPKIDKLGRDLRGTVAVEFALVCLPLLMMIFTLMDVMYLMTIDFMLTDALQEAARHASVGSTAPMTGTGVGDYMVAHTGTLLQRSGLTVTVTAYNSAKIYLAAPAGMNPAAGSGGSGQFVKYQATYVQPLLSPLGFASSASTSFTHSVTYLVQNEPF